MTNDRQQWLEERRKGIGSSDIAALFGVSPYASPLSVYASKLGFDMGPQDEASEIRMRVGRELEGMVCELAAAEFKEEAKVRRNFDSFEMPGHCHIRSTPDGTIWSYREEPGVLEAKVVGEHAPSTWHHGVVPQDHELQVRHQMLVTGRTHGVIAALLLGPSKLLVREIEWDQKVADAIKAKCDDFWFNHVVPRVPPPADGHPATARAIKALHPSDSGLMVELGAKEMEEAATLQHCKHLIADVDAQSDELQNKLRLAMGDATYGILPDGTGLSLKAQTRGGTTFRVLRTMSPDAVAKVREDCDKRLKEAVE